MFKKVENNVNLVELEERILEFWKKNRIFDKSLEKNKNGRKFIFYEGPPTANGEPGVHHVLSRVFKDIFPRYKTMKGYNVPRKAGWDTHGLPVEIEIEKKLNINSKKEIEKIGIEKFNRLCKESVMKYEGEWKKLTERIGFWLDMEHAYFTFNNDYIETVWWILKTIWDRNLLYEDFKIVPYCSRCGTALSSHEVALGYRDIEDFSVIVKFELEKKENTKLLVWTTTPWTLISNVACAVNADAEYVEINYNSENLILAENLLKTVFGPGECEYKINSRFKGAELLSYNYNPIYKYTDDKNAFRIIAGDYVSIDDGTGIVHIAPAFGEEDMRVGKLNNLPVVQMVNEEGNFKDEVKGFAGLNTEEANPAVIEDLKKRNLLFKTKKFEHSYPFCWRCDKKLIYYAKKSWYIRTSEIKENLLKANDAINWYPEHIKYGRFGKWLENNVDWALTRERYWGTPLPIWSDENGHKICIGSIEELSENALNMPGKIDLHKPFVDWITIKCKICGADMHRTPEVIDVWFDSGSMPFAQFHYPFENKETFFDNYPADFICEAIDQTRGWFYTMLTISTLLFNKSSYKNVLCLGLINDESGQKMSKSKGNVVKPWSILNKQGADALRWYFFTSVSPWNPKNFSIKAIDEVVRKFILTLWNVYSFFVIYANIDKFSPGDHTLEVNERPEIDKWIISELNMTIEGVSRLLDNFNVTDAGKMIENFIDDLSNWYVRRNRRRFWKSEEDSEKIGAYKTLYECLLTISKLSAPFIPFLSEEIYKNLTGNSINKLESVHLEDYPIVDKSLIDIDLNLKMDIIRKIIGLGRSVRSKINIKTRQPLASVKIYFEYDKNKIDACEHFKEVIKEELNVKDIEFAGNIEELISFTVKPNLKLLGPKYGQGLPKIKDLMEKENSLQIALKARGGKIINLMLDGKQIEILPEEVLVEVKNKENFGIESDGEFTIGLPSTFSPDLADEGFCRELIHQVQNLRKEAGFEIENLISTSIICLPDDEIVIKKYIDYIKKETLSRHLIFTMEENMFIRDLKINKSILKIGIKVIGNIN